MTADADPTASTEPERDTHQDRNAHQAAVDAFAFRVWSYRQGEVVSLLVHLGHRLGLYRALDGTGPLTADELAERTGYHPRFLLEWLRAQAAAGLLDSADGEHFELSAAGAEVLVEDHQSLRFAAGAFGPPLEPSVVDDLATAFRTGLGLPYDRFGLAGVHRTEGMLGPWARRALLEQILPLVDGVVAKLEAGATVADVGCGSALALRTLAAAFPRSRFEGFELSSVAAGRARSLVAEAGLTNVTVHERRAEDLPAGADYDLVLSFDCLHDMTRPADAAAAVRRAIGPEGTWLVKEIRCADTWEGNLKNPMLAMFLGLSVTTCLSSSLSEPGGAGLGTIGLPPSALRQLAEGAGFRRFRQLSVDDPANLYYEIRP
jgi:SAM-dependent methyltransferase